MELYVEDGIWQNARVKTVKDLLDEGWIIAESVCCMLEEIKKSYNNLIKELNQ